jgi:hypothetical protein
MTDQRPAGAASQKSFKEILADYNRNPTYERRIIVFYDILGWRGVTESTQGIPERIGALRREVLLHSRVLHASKAASSNVTTFSDNIVISAPVDEHAHLLLRAVTLMQMMTQSRGLLIRGGITIGEILHDSECVFGPGLNRAYDLERKHAKYPRIVLDPEVAQCDGLVDFTSVVDGIRFLDPFRREFRDEITRSRNVGANGEKLKTEETWKWEYGVFVEVLKGASGEKEREKIAWLIDRIAHHAGLPTATHYISKQA